MGFCGFFGLIDVYKRQMLEYMPGWCNYRLETLHDEKERARVCGIDESAVRKDVLAIVLEEPLEVDVYKRQLEWIGKSKVINHHQEVPFRVLERKYSFDENGQHNEEMCIRDRP